jgi:hypothetical protein
MKQHQNLNGDTTSCSGIPHGEGAALLHSHRMIFASMNTKIGDELNVNGVDQPPAKVVDFSTSIGATITLKVPGHAYLAGAHWSETGMYARAEFQVYLVNAIGRDPDGLPLPVRVYAHLIAAFPVRTP